MTRQSVTAATQKQALLTAVAPKTATYLSADEVERADARTHWYETVCRQLKSAAVIASHGFVAQLIPPPHVRPDAGVAQAKGADVSALRNIGLGRGDRRGKATSRGKRMSR